MSLLTDENVTLLCDFLLEKGITFERDVDMSHFSYMRTGGVAQLMIFPQSRNDLSETMRFLYIKQFRYKVIGSTSNLLFLDGTTFSVILSTARLTSLNFNPETGQFEVECGVMLPELSRQALYRSVTGYEGLEGIPGTVGGGLYMNAGAYGYELKRVFVKAELVQPDGTVVLKDAIDFKLGHRTSLLREEQAGSVVWKLWFSATVGDPEKIYRRMEMFHAKRHRYQEFLYPNLGSLYSGNPYRELAKSDKFFMAILSGYSLIRYRLKPFHRESPINRHWINKIAMKRFGLQYPTQPFSDKTLNCLVNRGQGTDEMLRFIEDMERLVGKKIPMENEIVDSF